MAGSFASASAVTRIVSAATELPEAVTLTLLVRRAAVAPSPARKRNGGERLCERLLPAYELIPGYAVDAARRLPGGSPTRSSLRPNRACGLLERTGASLLPSACDRAAHESPFPNGGGSAPEEPPTSP
jgi:hypothetical protein